MSSQAIKIVEEEIDRVRKEWWVDDARVGSSDTNAVEMATNSLLERITERINKEVTP